MSGAGANDLWYVQHGSSASVGPVTTDLLAKGVKAGRVPLTASICPLGGKDWVPLATHPYFADVVRELAPPPPPPSTSKPNVASGPVTFDAHDLVEDEKTVMNEPRFHGATAAPPSAVPTAPTVPFRPAPMEATFPRPFVPGEVVPPKPSANGWLARNMARLRDLPARDRRVAAVILGSCFGVAVVIASAAFFLAPDKARPNYDKCVQADTAGDIEGAWTTCYDAVGADPNSTSGKEAATMLGEMKPKYDAWKKDQEAKAAAAAGTQRKADEARRQAEAEARADAIRALRRRVSAKYWGFDPDGNCQAEGKPPFRKDYEGGTYDENETVALGDGCVHLFQAHMTHSPNDNTFCCPK